jgi:hypothetical protein
MKYIRYLVRNLPATMEQLIVPSTIELHPMLEHPRRHKIDQQIYQLAQEKASILKWYNMVELDAQEVIVDGLGLRERFTTQLSVALEPQHFFTEAE